MPYIQPNLFYQADKLIKPYECAMIVVEGPNLKGKMNLDGLEIKYENYTLSQLILNPSSSDQPMLYGFLGNNITFLMVRAKYIPMDPNWAIETEQYIEYYFSDDTKVRQMGQIMILSGNSVKRIPQIYFNNPSTKNRVYLEVLMANLEQDSLTNLNQFKQTSSFSGLYYNSIISDSIGYIIPTSTGSTELKVIDTDGRTLIIIPYTNIKSIAKIDPLTLLIGLDTEEKVRLSFLSAYNCCQANSRINWVMMSNRYRILTPSQPTLDITSPVISFNSILTGTTTGITSGVTTLYLLPSGTTYSYTDLKNIFISGIVDNMDGNIDKLDAVVTINMLNDLVPISGITDVGIYNVIFSITDLACNTISYEFYISIYTVSYGIYYTYYNGLWYVINV